jgi:hypothetical protein
MLPQKIELSGGIASIVETLQSLLPIITAATSPLHSLTPLACTLARPLRTLRTAPRPRAPRLLVPWWSREGHFAVRIHHPVNPDGGYYALRGKRYTP